MGTEVYSYKKSHIFVDKILTVVTTSVNIKYISEFKLVWKYLSQKYNVFFFDYLKKYVIWHLTCSKDNCYWGYLPSPYPSSTRINSVCSASVRIFSQIVCLSDCLCIWTFLKLMQKFFWKFCRDLWKKLSWWSKFIKLFWHLSLFPGELFWIIFPLFFCIGTFFIFLFFMKSIHLLHNTFFRVT